MDEYEESEIASGLREGSTAAWQRLYDAHAERIWRLVAGAMLTDASDIADVVQDTFLAAARSAHGYDRQRGPLASWLNGIARHQIALYYRRRRQSASVVGAGMTPVGPIENAVTSDDCDPAAVLAGLELAQQIRTALTQLPVDYEILLTRKYMDGESVQQIAEHECATHEAIRSRLARARRAFRRAFERQNTSAS
jgi:RNA polymerase sigma-70 factor (ECF subfamily)